MPSFKLFIPLCFILVLLLTQSCSRHATCSAYSGKIITPNRTCKFNKAKKANGQRTTRYKYQRSRRFKFKSLKPSKTQRMRAKF